MRGFGCAHSEVEVLHDITHGFLHGQQWRHDRAIQKPAHAADHNLHNHNQSDIVQSRPTTADCDVLVQRLLPRNQLLFFLPQLLAKRILGRNNLGIKFGHRFIFAPLAGDPNHRIDSCNVVAHQRRDLRCACAGLYLIIFHPLLQALHFFGNFLGKPVTQIAVFFHNQRQQQRARFFEMVRHIRHDQKLRHRFLIDLVNAFAHLRQIQPAQQPGQQQSGHSQQHQRGQFFSNGHGASSAQGKVRTTLTDLSSALRSA